MRLRLLEDQVLDQVRGLQRGASVVQGLEDDLCVVLRLEIDNDQLELVTKHAHQGIKALVQPVFVVQFMCPLDRAVAKQPVRLDDRRAIRSDGERDVDGPPQPTVHDHAEGITVDVGRPHLINRMWVVGHVVVIGSQFDERTYVFVLDVEFPCDIADRGKEDLKCGQPLLSVDDLSGGHRPCERLQLIEHDSTKKVRMNLSFRHPLLDQGGDVLPQRAPVPLLRPDVRPLKDRNDESPVRPEQVAQGHRFRFHTILRLRRSARAECLPKTPTR